MSQGHRCVQLHGRKRAYVVNDRQKGKAEALELLAKSVAAAVLVREVPDDCAVAE